MMSLTVSGMPCSGPRVRPSASSASRSAASRRAAFGIGGDDGAVGVGFGGCERGFDQGRRGNGARTQLCLSLDQRRRGREAPRDEATVRRGRVGRDRVGRGGDRHARRGDGAGWRLPFERRRLRRYRCIELVEEVRRLVEGDAGCAPFVETHADACAAPARPDDARGGEGDEECVRSGDRSEHATLHLHHLDRGGIVARVRCAGAVGEQQALVATVVGLAHRRVHAHIGGDSGEDDVRDPTVAQHEVEVGRVEGALAGLVDDDLTFDRRDLRHDLPPGLAAHQDAPARTAITDARSDALRPPELVLGTIRQIGSMALASVDDGGSPSSDCIEHPTGGFEPTTGEREVVAHLVDVPAGSAEVDLPVDADEGCAFRDDGLVVGPRVRGRVHLCRCPVRFVHDWLLEH